MLDGSPQSMLSLILEVIGEDPSREGLLDTPDRVVRSWKEIYGGYNEDPKAHLSKTFDSASSQMVSVNGIEFFSTCEHHMLPFHGTADVTYIPKSKVVGLSKVARMVSGYARRLQIQERLTDQIADAMLSIDGVESVAVRVRAKHFCMVARGVRNGGAQMTTTALRGCLLYTSDAADE